MGSYNLNSKLSESRVQLWIRERLKIICLSVYWYMNEMNSQNFYPFNRYYRFGSFMCSHNNSSFLSELWVFQKHLRFGGKTSPFEGNVSSGKVKFYWIFVCISLRRIYQYIRIKQIKLNSSTVCFDIKFTPNKSRFKKKRKKLFFSKIEESSHFLYLVLHVLTFTSRDFLICYQKKLNSVDKWVFDSIYVNLLPMK